MSDYRRVPIAGADASPSDVTLSFGGAPFAAVAANMESVMQIVGDLAAAAKTTLSSGDIEYIDVELALGVDGSVGLLSTKAGMTAKGTFTVRVRP